MRIKAEVDIISALNFLLIFFGSIVALFYFFSGSNPEILMPKQVIIYSEASSDNDIKPAISMISSVSNIVHGNNTTAIYDITASINGYDQIFKWSSLQKVKRNGRILDIEITEYAEPIKITPGDMISKRVGLSLSCDEKKSLCKGGMKPFANFVDFINNNRVVSVSIKASFIGKYEKSSSINCEMEVDDDDIIHVAKNYWVTFRCKAS